MKVGSNLDSKGYGIATPVDSELKWVIFTCIVYLEQMSNNETKEVVVK
jgi:hypothetical protein